MGAGVAQGVGRHETGTGNDVIVHQQNHVPRARLHTDVECRHLADGVGREMAHGREVAPERFELAGRTIDVAIEHDDHFSGGGVGRDGAHEAPQQVTPVPGGEDDRHGRRARARVRPPVAFIAWGAVSGRSREIADALGGEAHCLFPPEATWRPHPIVRYLLCSLDTIRYVLSRRPRSLVVTNPPVVAGLVTLACGRIIGSPVVLDSHPGAFGAQGDAVSARLQAVNRWLVRHADGSIVASAPWVDQVQAWGGEAVELHEAPGFDAPARTVRRNGPLRVLCVGRLAPDEPFEEMIRAAALVPDCTFLVTGHVERVPQVRELAPPNLTFTGFLPSDQYEAALVDADIVMTLTTEPSSIMRAAYEAVYARRPLIVTDWPLGCEVFPYAVHVHNDTESIAEGVRRARDEFDALVAMTEQARAVQLSRWSMQIPQLRRMLRIPDHEGDGSSEGPNAGS